MQNRVYYRDYVLSKVICGGVGMTKEGLEIVLNQ